MKNIIIIGSGLGGLECAHILSAKGYHVTVLERETQPGGCMQSYRRRGLDFDTGFHYIGGLGEGQQLHEAFQKLGLLKLPWVRLDEDCFDRIHIEGESYDFAQGYDNFVETLSQKFPEERKGLQEYSEILRNTPQQTWTESAWGWLHEHFHNETLINVLSGNSIRQELRKETLPMFTFSHINSSFINSSWRLKGSGNLIVNSLIDDIRHNGGEVICNAEVTQLIEKDGSIVSAICSNGETYDADFFISDMHPTLTYDLIKDSKVLKKIFRRRMHMLENTYGILTVSLVIKPETLEYVNHNDYIYSKQNLWEEYENDKPVSGIMVSYRVPEDGSRYVRQIDLLTPVQWNDCYQWSDTRVGRRGSDYNEWKRQKSEECLSLAETVIPGLKSKIESQYVSSPLTYRDYTLTPNGSAYGLRKDCGSPLLTVLSPKTPEQNLFLTGQSLMLHGVEGVTMTAMFTCKEITETSEKIN